MNNFQQLERELTAYFAEKLDLVVDTSFFRGQIPESVESGAALQITNILENNDFSQPMYAVQILGKYPTRDEAWSLACKCAALVPVYGEQTEHFAIAFIQGQGGANAPVQVEDKGRRFQFVSVNFIAAVLTRPA